MTTHQIWYTIDKQAGKDRRLIRRRQLQPELRRKSREGVRRRVTASVSTGVPLSHAASSTTATSGSDRGGAGNHRVVHLTKAVRFVALSRGQRSGDHPARPPRAHERANHRVEVPEGEERRDRRNLCMWGGFLFLFISINYIFDLGEEMMSKTNINNAANEYVAQPRATKTEPHIYIYTYVCTSSFTRANNDHRRQARPFFVCIARLLGGVGHRRFDRARIFSLSLSQAR